MADGEQDVYTDTLFVALTRPAMMWGVPLGAFVTEFVATTLIFLGVGNPLYLVLIVPIHTVMYLISAHDPGVFSSIYVWVQTIGKCLNRKFWGAASFSPLPTKKWKQ